MDQATPQCPHRISNERTAAVRLRVPTARTSSRMSRSRVGALVMSRYSARRWLRPAPSVSASTSETSERGVALSRGAASAASTTALAML